MLKFVLLILLTKLTPLGILEALPPLLGPILNIIKTDATDNNELNIIIELFYKNLKDIYELPKIPT
jgi:hypothetical protein